MMGKGKIVTAAVFGAVLTAGAGVVIAGVGNATGGDVDFQRVVWTTEPLDAPKNWKPVPEVGTLNNGPDPHSVIVSAEMSKGKAKFRVIDTPSGPPTEPGPVTFIAPGPNSFTWSWLDGCMLGVPRLEWKRAGRKPVVAKVISTVQIYDAQVCI